MLFSKCIKAYMGDKLHPLPRGPAMGHVARRVHHT